MRLGIQRAASRSHVYRMLAPTICLNTNGHLTSFGTTILSFITKNHRSSLAMSKFAPHHRSAPRASSTTVCQKCLRTGMKSRTFGILLEKQTNLYNWNEFLFLVPWGFLILGHFTYECKNTRPYVSRPSRTQQLENPRALAKLKAEGKPSVDVPEEFKRK